MSGTALRAPREPARPAAAHWISAAHTLLVVDDSPAAIAVVDETLRAEFRIRVATGGHEALAALERHPEVDLILLDVLMQDMDGFEACRRIKGTPALRDIPIIFLTSLGETGDEAYGLGLGAVDYIAKPVAPEILRARVHTHLETCRVRRDLQRENAILSVEREVIEGMIVRMRADPEFDGRHLRWLTQPVEKTSGDICLAAFGPDGRQTILLGDFCGHGLASAIAGPALKQAFYSLCANGASLSHTLAALNDLLCTQLLVSQFMATHLLEIDPRRRQARLWGGGMPEPLHADAGGEMRRIPVKGLPLGVVPSREMPCEVHRLTLHAGERILLYTDGITEATNAAGEFYRVDRLQARYAELLGSGGALAELVDDLDTFSAGRAPVDDVSLLEITV